MIQQLGEKKKAQEKEKENKEQNQDDEPEIIDVKRPTDVLGKETSAEQKKSTASYSEALRIFETCSECITMLSNSRVFWVGCK